MFAVPVGWRAVAAAPLHALRDTAASPALARTQGAWALICVATWTYTVVVAVYAFRAGGAAGVGLAVVLRTLPSVLAGPAVGELADRISRAAVMTGSACASAIALGLSATAAALGAPELPVYLLGLVVTVAGMAFRAAQSAIMPALARDPRALASANVVTSTVESAAVFAGPALAAVVLAAAGPALGFALAALLVFAAAILVAGLEGAAGAPQATAATGGSLRAAAAHPIVRLVLGLLLAQTFVSGALTVYYVLCAIELLQIGESGVGLLTAAYGAGGVLGSLAAFGLAGSRRLVGVMAAGLLLWGAPLALLGVAAAPVVAVTLLLAIGVGNVLFDVATVTLLQRSVPDHILARVFGTLETVVVLGLGLGATVAPLLASALGVRGALVATGALPLAVALLARAALIRADGAARLPLRELAVLRMVPMFAGLPGPVLENLAFHARHVTVNAGSAAVTQGERGDDYYVVADGRLRVLVDGRQVGDRRVGDGFGEIALLRDVPRIATVEAVDDSELLAVRREPFIAAVTGHAAALDDANAVVASHIAAAGITRHAH